MEEDGKNKEEFKWLGEDPLFIFKNEVPNRVKMHVKPLDLENNTWMKIDSTFPSQMALRADLLQTKRNEVFVSRPNSPSTSLAKAEVLDLLFESLPKDYPQLYRIIIEDNKEGLLNLYSGEKFF